MEDLLEDLRHEDDWNSISYEPLDEWHRRQKEMERKRCEGIARQIAAEDGVEPGSLDFIRACYRRIEVMRDRWEDWNSEGRFFHGAACVAALGSARGSEVFYDDCNYTEGRWREQEATVHDVLRWIKSECPLLWTLWLEKRCGASE